MWGYRLILATMLFLVSACGVQSYQGQYVPVGVPESGGRPAVKIRGAEKKQVIDALIADGIARGYSVRTASDYLIVLGQPAQGMAAMVLFGTGHSPTPETRLLYSVSQIDGGILVVGTGGIVSNPGTGLEHMTDLTEGQFAMQVQTLLDGIRVRLER